jgi:hypothetical protein
MQLNQLVPKTSWHMIDGFREQAERAERLAKSIDDARTSDALLTYAKECWEMASKQHVYQDHQSAAQEPAH